MYGFYVTIWITVQDISAHHCSTTAAHTRACCSYLTKSTGRVSRYGMPHTCSTRHPHLQHAALTPAARGTHTCSMQHSHLQHAALTPAVRNTWHSHTPAPVHLQYKEIIIGNIHPPALTRHPPAPPTQVLWVGCSTKYQRSGKCALLNAETLTWNRCCCKWSPGMNNIINPARTTLADVPGRNTIIKPVRTTLQGVSGRNNIINTVKIRWCRKRKHLRSGWSSQDFCKFAQLRTTPAARTEQQ